jgi:hypothetical protein
LGPTKMRWVAVPVLPAASVAFHVTVTCKEHTTHASCGGCDDLVPSPPRTGAPKAHASATSSHRVRPNLAHTESL